MGKDFERLLNRDSPPPPLNSTRPPPDNLHAAANPLPLPPSTEDTSDWPRESNSASHSSSSGSLITPAPEQSAPSSCPATSPLPLWTAVNHPAPSQSSLDQPSGPKPESTSVPGPTEQQTQPHPFGSSPLPSSNPLETGSRGRILKPRIPTGKILIKKVSTVSSRLEPLDHGESPRPPKKARTLIGPAAASFLSFGSNGQLPSTTAAPKESPATPSPTPSPVPDLPGSNSASCAVPSLLSPIHCKESNARPLAALIQKAFPTGHSRESARGKVADPERSSASRITSKTTSAMARLQSPSSSSEQSSQTNGSVSLQVMPPPARRPERSKQGNQFDSHGGLLSPPLHHASQPDISSLLVKSESDIQGELNAGDDVDDERKSHLMPASPQNGVYLNTGESHQPTGFSDDYTIYRCDYCNEVWREEIAVSRPASSQIMDLTAMEAFSDMMRSQSKRVKEAYEQWQMNHDSNCASQYMLQSSGNRNRLSSPSPPPSQARPTSQHSSHSTSEPIVFGTPYDNANTKWFDVCLGEHSGSPKPVRISEHHPYYHAIQIPSPPVHLAAPHAGSSNLEYHADGITHRRAEDADAPPQPRS